MGRPIEGQRKKCPLKSSASIFGFTSRMRMATILFCCPQTVKFVGLSLPGPGIQR
jgi:hypothetical protein